MTGTLVMLGLGVLGLIALINLHDRQRRRQMTAEERTLEDRETAMDSNIW